MITQSNFMTNILPQADRMNRGAWLESEMIIECLRDKEVLHIIGGTVYPPPVGTGPVPANQLGRADWFQRSHGVLNPIFFWKVIQASKTGEHAADGGLLALWIPNHESATAAVFRTSEYVVSVAELEANLQTYGGIAEKFTLTPAEAASKPVKVWTPATGCDRGRR